MDLEEILVPYVYPIAGAFFVLAVVLRLYEKGWTRKRLVALLPHLLAGLLLIAVWAWRTWFG